MNNSGNSIIAVILNWNEIELTVKCLQSLYAQRDISLDILLVDNHSREFPSRNLIDRFPDLRIIMLPENKGVAGGRNEGLRYAVENRYDYILFLDNDAYAHTYMVKELKKVIDRDKNIGITGPKIYRDDGSSHVIWRAGCLSWQAVYLYSWFSIIKRYYLLQKKAVPYDFDLVRGDGHKDRGQFEKEIDIDFQIGCTQMIKTELVKVLGSLDERFSPYGSEDIDYCERTKKAGWRIRYAPKAICWHRVTLQHTADPQRIYHNLKNIILLARKHLSIEKMLFYFLPDFILIHLPLIAIDSVLKGPDCAKAVIDAVKWHLSDIKSHGFFLNR